MRGTSVPVQDVKLWRKPLRQGLLCLELRIAYDVPGSGDRVIGRIFCEEVN